MMGADDRKAARIVLEGPTSERREVCRREALQFVELDDAFVFRKVPVR
ncbi:MAG: hypothetical protein J4F40_18980 [Alphaproteobacteria bacterium]|nr:hypothetical protein [Alphaproteobacteria bacterium]